ncbi:hypothetical protein [Streptomyces alkaliterrae]|uniref:Uncharacterized protein n=1 Tax=Streptomyces alkaliterrae TaxID=2213162 RepID=A0A5P0YU70_9ACTN|nr:hypothetical protein [Streptomyces alkaliterrae]MBB1261842.1 hypothetical protein [Streptomyces alkaliterrae]MQS03828.1 hypothetical protein [Streptomyces alkaliterrae]
MTSHEPGSADHPYTPPPPPRGGRGKALGFGCLGALIVLAFLVVVALAVRDDGGDSEELPSPTPATTGPADPGVEEPEGPEAREEAAEFRECVEENGTDPEKMALQRVTAVTGSRDLNRENAAAEVFTDLPGGRVGPSIGQARLIAGAFASCYEADNGTVTVYSADGNMLATGRF